MEITDDSCFIADENASVCGCNGMVWLQQRHCTSNHNASYVFIVVKQHVHKDGRGRGEDILAVRKGCGWVAGWSEGGILFQGKRNHIQPLPPPPSLTVDIRPSSIELLMDEV